MELGMLLLRIVIGLLFVGHGAQKLFGWFGGHGLDGTGGFMESLGYRRGRMHAGLAGTAEAVGGGLLAIGFLVPLAAAAIVGVMVNAIATVHADNGMWNSEGGMEYPLVLIVSAAALAFVGPGYLALDNALDLELAGTGWGILTLIVGFATGAAVLIAQGVPEEMAEAEPEREEERRAA